MTRCDSGLLLHQTWCQSCCWLITTLTSSSSHRMCEQVVADFHSPLCSSLMTLADCFVTWDRMSGPFFFFRLKLCMFSLDTSKSLLHHLNLLIVSWRLLWTPQPTPSLLSFFREIKMGLILYFILVLWKHITRIVKTCKFCTLLDFDNILNYLQSN